MSKAVKLIIGIALIALGIWTIVIWWGDVLTMIRGGIGLVLILAGLIAFAVLD
ncbi:MAG TPA: hypothetical protein VMD02_00650 [Candidatus Omnitrophota bacterium]|nr:hypothetical protein [Candidatus Omnitrophota bacterium]